MFWRHKWGHHLKLQYKLVELFSGVDLCEGWAVIRTQDSKAWSWGLHISLLGSSSPRLPSVALLGTRFEFVPGSWRLKRSLHTVQSPHPTRAGCCHGSRYTVVMNLREQWWEDGPWDRLRTGLFRKYHSAGVGKTLALPHPDSRSVQWPPWCGQRTAVSAVRSSASPTSWPSYHERRWRTGLICKYMLSAQKKKKRKL